MGFSGRCFGLTVRGGVAELTGALTTGLIPSRASMNRLIPRPASYGRGLNPIEIGVQLDLVQAASVDRDFQGGNGHGGGS